MARKNKRGAKRTRTKVSVRKKKEKKNSNFSIISGVVVVAVLLLAAFFYFGNSTPAQTSNEETETVANPTSATAQGGACQKDNQCFITHCKGQEVDCVNTTELSGYAKNCNTYLDWVVDRQDYSACACVSNVCTMLK